MYDAGITLRNRDSGGNEHGKNYIQPVEITIAPKTVVLQFALDEFPRNSDIIILLTTVDFIKA